MIAFFIHIKKDVQNYSIILNSATLFQKKQFKVLSNNILPNALNCQKIHLT